MSLSDSPCKTCRMSPDEKAACCGCWDRLEWERERKNTSDKLIHEQAYKQGYEEGFADGRQSILDELGIFPYQYEILKMAFTKNTKKEDKE